MTGNSATVLIVDDEAMVRDLYRVALEHAGYQVVEAPDGQAGLEVAATAKPAMILLDVRMPRLNGIEMLRKLKESDATREVPVVVLSNFDEPSVVRESLELGAHGYLVKVGTDPRELANVVEKVLAGSAIESVRLRN
ncbi:MAG TPA: response regulator [Candidatus Dormibacteraeota bacterium]|nr:response regulator [Candidatus Dormibacteraeota bacterium]